MELGSYLNLTNGERINITDDEAASIGVAVNTQHFVKIGRLNRTIKTFSISDFGARKKVQCHKCEKAFFNDAVHYCDVEGKYTTYTVAESRGDHIPRYSDKTIQIIRSRKNPPKGDLNYVAHMERTTGLFAEGGRTYYPPEKSPEAKKLRDKIKSWRVL